jgi:hypothetical protein
VLGSGPHVQNGTDQQIEAQRGLIEEEIDIAADDGRSLVERGQEATLGLPVWLPFIAGGSPLDEEQIARRAGRHPAAKLRWFRLGQEVSDLDHDYLRRGADVLA